MALAVSLTGWITDIVTETIGDHGVYAVFMLMLVDAVLPAASELVMVYSGALAAGAFSSGVVLFGADVESGWPAYLVMVAAGTIGYTIGSILGWAIGVYGGRPYLERHGRWLHLPPERLDKAERWFDRFGDAAVFLGRITPVVRSFISIPAGVFEAKLGRYTVLTFIGSALWCFAFAGVGWAVGSNWEAFHERFHLVDYAVAAAIVALVAYAVVRRRRSTRLDRSADPAR
ncbi:MAG TPA: DedA family protein [Gaiellaceae bacterium]|nr:DedA family protein [Gaiellaceae bacterium]